MVCKEELCRWFKNLSPPKRIEYMCALLHMCLPLELRFMGTVLEHYGKNDYHYLRNDEVTANKQSDILKFKNITKPEVLRSKVSVTLALMRSSSTACAQIIYELIESKLATVFSFGPGADSREVEEILTVLTLAANHPAFMFEQRLRLHEQLNSLILQRGKVEEEVSLDFDNHLHHYPAEEAPMPVHHAALFNRYSPVSQARKVYVQQIEVRGPKKVPEKKAGPEYVIVATWSNGEATEVAKRFREIQDFHRQMIDMFPDEKPPNGRLPSLPAGSRHQHTSHEEHIAEQIRTLSSYFRTLTNAPSHILESDHVCQFFKGVVIQPAHTLSMVTPPHPYSPQDDPAGRLHRFYPNHQPMYFVQSRFPSGHACQTLLMPTAQMPAVALHQHQHQHQHPQQQPSLQQPPPLPQPVQQPTHHQQQPSPVSSRSELSSTTTSPTGSRSASPSMDPGSSSLASVTQLLKVLGLEKYSTALGGLDFQQLSSLSCEELSKHGLPREAQQILRSRLDQINSEKPVLLNGLVDSSSLVYPPFSQPPSSIPWLSATYYSRAPPMPPASPRSGMSVMDSLLSDVASGSSPPVSPGPSKLHGVFSKGTTAAEDSSEGSDDLGREKGEGLIHEGTKNHQQSGKTAQVKVSTGSGGGGEGGSSSPRPSSANSRMTPPDDSACVKSQPPLQVLPPTIPQFYYTNPLLTTHTHAPPGLQFVDPKGEVGMMGVMPQQLPGSNISANNTNNNYTTETMSNPSLIRTASIQGAVGRGGPFKGAQPQPAHTNMGILHGKNLISMPAEPKPGSPVIPFLRSTDTMQTPGMVQQQQVGGTSAMEGVGGVAPPQRLYMPYNPMLSAQLPLQHAQPAMFSYPQPTRSVQTSLPGSASVMTMSASHPVTVVTSSHSCATTAITTAVHRSPSHGNANSQQRDSSNESLGNGGGSSVGGVVTDGSLRSSPLQGGIGVGIGVTPVPATAASPPVGVTQGCQMCAQGAAIQQFTHSGQYSGQFYPYPAPPYYSLPPGTNGLVPMATASYLPGASNQSVSGLLTNGYTTDMYSYSNPMAYPPHANPLTPSMYSMLQGSTLYQANPPSQPALSNPRSSMPPPPQPLLGSVGGLGATGGQPGTGTLSTMKQRNTGCYNCGSLSHKAAECNESSMETMSGKSVYSLDFKPPEESD